MLAWGVTRDDLQSVATDTGVRLYEVDERGKAVKFTLRPEGETYRLINAVSGRRINAVCFHGHYLFMKKLFDRCPDARIKSTMADYRGWEEFRDKAGHAAYRNVGSQRFPVLYADACRCDE